MFPVRSRVALAALLFALLGASVADDKAPERIQPYPANPRYWQYNGKPVVLLGGTDYHNLFQAPDMEQQLRRLASVGGNYVRNTMSAREAGNVQPFLRLSDGRYDLERWNDEYWRRFDNLLRLARALDIVVQIEIWDRFDYSRQQWENQPFNPRNNVNYSYEESDFSNEYPQHPGENKQPFFFATPAQRNNAAIFRYQKRFVDELLRRSLPYPNVLYCIDNETSGDEAWGAYWADYLRKRADAAGVRIAVTQMWDDWNLRAEQHRRTFDHPRRYDYIDISQNNHQRGDSHWNNFQWAYRHLAAKPRPINTIKTYGADRESTDGAVERLRKLLRPEPDIDTPGDYGSTQHGTERWWRHLIGGAAGARFHRPPSGIGLNEVAQRHIRSARMLLREFDVVNAAPDADHELLSGRDRNEAYLTRIGTTAYAVYFPDGGQVDLAIASKTYATVRWLDIAASRWNLAEKSTYKNGRIRLRAPGRGHWVALVTGGGSQ